MGDYNGDGKTDFTIPTAEKYTTWKFFFSKGNSIKSQNVTVVSFFKNDSNYTYYYIANDYNGDGKTDIIRHKRYNKNRSNIRRGRRRGGRRFSYSSINLYENVFQNRNTSDYFSLETSFYAPKVTYNVGVPIFLEATKSNGNLEYAYASENRIQAYEFKKDHREEVTLKSVENNGVTTSIEYERMRENFIYTPDYDEKYPYINVNYAPSLQLVQGLTKTGAGITSQQNFRYKGAVSSVNLGFLGFKTVSRTNWYGDGVSMIWSGTQRNPQLKGAVTEQWTGHYSLSKQNYITKTTTTYNTTLANNKVFTNLPTKMVTQNRLQNTTTTQTLTYDAYKNPATTTTVFSGGKKETSYTYSNNPTTMDKTYYIGRITKKVETNTIGGNSFTTEQQYSYDNNLLTEQKTKGENTSWNTQNMYYDKAGNITRKVIDAKGLSSRVEWFKYDKSFRFLIESTDIEGLKTVFTYDVFGNPLTTTKASPFNTEITYAYDGWNRLIKQTNYLGSITKFSYNPLPSGSFQKKTEFPEGGDETINYNALGWVTKTEKQGFKDQWTKQRFEYDVAGKKLRESEPYFNAPSHWNSTAYDIYGRVISKESYTGKVARMTYDDLSVTVDDGTKTVTTTKNGAGNIVKLTDPGGTITYQYYGNGVMKAANYGSYAITTKIDGWGRKSKLIDPSAGTYTYTYNNWGDVTKETTPMGATEYSYDSKGKLTQKKQMGTNTDMLTNYTYDKDSKLITKIEGENNKSKKSFTYNYEYNYFQMLYRTEEKAGDNTFTYEISIFDGYGRVRAARYRVTTPNTSSNIKIYNIYDSNGGMLKEIQEFYSDKVLWKLDELNQRGQPLKITLGNGIEKTRTYDTYGLVTQTLDKTPKGANKPITALNLTYSFDPKMGNLTNRNNKAFNWKEEFTYDNLDRLTQISGATNHKQTYDKQGRIANNSYIGAYAYNPAKKYQLKTIKLNKQGDLYYQQGQHNLQQISYNAFKKPVTIYQKDKGRITFEYDPMMNRTAAYYGGLQEKKEQRTFTKYYASSVPVELVKNNTTGKTKIITYIGGDAYTAPIAYIKQTDKNSLNGMYYLHRDYLGSILAITDSKGTVQEQRQFGAWGSVDKFLDKDKNTTFGNSSLITRGFTGHEHFFDVGLLHMNGRMYDSKLGRFLSPDNYIQEPFNTQNFIGMVMC